MAAYDGDYIISFDVSELTKQEKVAFDNLIGEWKNKFDENSCIMDWLFTIKAPKYIVESDSYHFDTAEKTQEFMECAGEMFPKLKGKLEGTLYYLMAGGERHDIYELDYGKVSFEEEEIEDEEIDDEEFDDYE